MSYRSPFQRTALVTLALACLAGTSLAASAPIQVQARNPTIADAPESPPGEGLICAWGLMALSEEVGRRCFPGKDEEFQTELAQGVARIDKFVLQNSDAKPEDLEKFKKDQAHVGAPEALLCQGDGIQIYNAFRAQGGAAIRSFTEKMVSRPGKPTWGTCL